VTIVAGREWGEPRSYWRSYMLSLGVTRRIDYSTVANTADKGGRVIHSIDLIPGPFPFQQRNPMIIRPILISALSRHRGLHLNYLPNAVKQRPQRLAPVTFGVAAALVLSLVGGLVHLDSDTFRNKETTVGGYFL
jgi:hypothetical protein